ncbi:serine hydrolase domain-containing protein [Kribbella catacumbae]|uniref:serine hydrolase domain-containing protein n=1 Tax=Kribbella catacumbae TaxID=460086 RepID=UPI00037AED76|nr:serine hydrolase domain-containing protein [Kribbella catacumbae]
MPDWTTRLAQLATESGVPGAVLGIWADGEQTIAPYGVLNRNTGLEVTADSVFQVGSISKIWTATLVAQLVADGKLSYDDAVVELLPEAPVDARITVRHLLTHQSGIDGDLFTDTGRGDDCVERYVALLGEVEQLFEPGTAYSYCNAGFVLLGRIIEVLDKRTWDATLQARLIEPLGLQQTMTLPEQAILHRNALGHTADGVPVKTWNLPRSIGPAGLISASAGDLLRFAQLHLDQYAEMRQPQAPFPGDGFEAIGLAWRLYDWSGRKLFGHDGQTVSQLAFLRIDPEARLAVCLLTNSANAPALFDQLVSEVFTHSVGVAAPPPPEPVAGAAGGDEHLGVFERAGVEMEVLRRDGRLLMIYRATGDRLAFAEEPIVEYELHLTAPADGNHFVTRSAPGQPWVPLTFTPTYLFTSGRVTPRRTG